MEPAQESYTSFRSPISTQSLKNIVEKEFEVMWKITKSYYEFYT